MPSLQIGKSTALKIMRYCGSFGTVQKTNYLFRCLDGGRSEQACEKYDEVLFAVIVVKLTA